MPIDVVLTRESDLDPEFVKFCRTVTAKRARIVIDHILQHGIVTTDTLLIEYNYTHPARAARDVREAGVPLITHTIGGKAAYTFGDPSKIKYGRIDGRKAFSKSFKKELIQEYGCREAFSHEPLEARYLQIDHRIPYEIAGDGADQSIENYMLIDSTSQRSKSWSCEKCPNWTQKDANVCRGCFWAYPEQYDHVATKPERRIILTWTGEDVTAYDALVARAAEAQMSVQDYLRGI